MNESRTMCLYELAARFGVSPKTLRAWIRRELPDLGHRPRTRYTPLQVHAIIDNFG